MPAEHARRRIRVALLVADIATCAASASAYWFLGPSWPSGTIPIELQLGSSGGALNDGSTDWDASAEDALFRWNQNLGRVRFTVSRNPGAPTGVPNGYNNLFWSDNAYGSPFGSNVLAISTSWDRGATMVEADVIVNRAYSFNSYRGPQWSNSVYDLHRVLLHEFGHTLGLDHPDEHGQSVAAIMNSRSGDLDHLVADDVAGVNTLYGATSIPPTSGPSPGAPTGLFAGVSGNVVTLSWRAPATGGTPIGYIIEAGSVSGSANLANVVTASLATTFTANNVGAGLYFVRVRAANAAGVSVASNELVVAVGIGCSGPPTAPSALLGSVSGATVMLSWNPSGGNPSAYIVEAGSAPGLLNLANSDTGSTIPSLTATGVARAIYWVRVRGRNTCGVGPASNEISIVVQ